MNVLQKMAGGQDRALSERTLVCLLQAAQGHRTTVELRNETSAEGFIDSVDGFMNICMSQVKFVKPNEASLRFPTMFIHGRQIRYVHIPDQIDMLQAIKSQLGKLALTRQSHQARKRPRTARGGRGGGRGRRPVEGP